MTADARVTAIREALEEPDESTSRVTLKVRTYYHQSGEGFPRVITGEVISSDNEMIVLDHHRGHAAISWEHVLDAWFPSDETIGPLEQAARRSRSAAGIASPGDASTTRPMPKVYIVTESGGDIVGIYEREEDAEMILKHFQLGQIDGRRLHDQIAAEDHLRDLDEAR